MLRRVAKRPISPPIFLVISISSLIELSIRQCELETAEVAPPPSLRLMRNAEVGPPAVLVETAEADQHNAELVRVAKRHYSSIDGGEIR